MGKIVSFQDYKEKKDPDLKYVSNEYIEKKLSKQLIFMIRFMSVSNNLTTDFKSKDNCSDIIDVNGHLFHAFYLVPVGNVDAQVKIVSIHDDIKMEFDEEQFLTYVNRLNNRNIKEVE